MHHTREAELKLIVKHMVERSMRESLNVDVQVRNVAIKVRRIPGTMDIEIDLMYCKTTSQSFESDEFEISLATCQQTVKNVSLEEKEKVNKIIKGIIENSMRSLKV